MSLSATLLSALVATVPDSVFTNPAPWEHVDTDGPLSLDRRAVANNPYFEYRVVTTTEVPVAVLCDAVFEWGTRGTDNPGTKLSKVLSDSADERVVYNQIEAPLVSNRDYAMTVKRDRADEAHCRIRFKITNDGAPPPPDGYVRMEQMWGGWQFDAVDGGKTQLTYVLFADPAGSVPTFLVHGGHKRSAKDSVRMALAKARAAQAAAKKGP